MHSSRRIIECGPKSVVFVEGVAKAVTHDIIRVMMDKQAFRVVRKRHDSAESLTAPPGQAWSGSAGVAGTHKAALG